MSKKYERINQLVKILKENHGASARELSDILEVSEMTIRRDLNELMMQKIVLNQYGAFFFNTELTNATDKLDEKYALNFAVTSNSEEKKRIGYFAASLVQENDILIIDTGSTTEYLARALSPDIKATILCYNRNILNYLVDKVNISILFAGGYYHANTEMFESVQGISLINQTRANKIFISAAGVHESLGITCANNYEIATKQAIFQSGVQKILLVDSSKFSVIKSSYFADIEDFDCIVTDIGISNSWIELIRSKNIQLHIV
ncbi:DeoR family transcriptional regulator [Lachnotalea glycerini]|uniref:DeoR family transcriptional regulator n=1 Tax=Lachnotalea glycerini TaxID=1763509 RepID=A0A255IJH9_9FIRM|nr:DeoR/GlpR family DNA-binding transcription regulator [Lachnotalea glycerini]PXV93322.1 DeoR family transcriptional regulator [Lachnotalea glycerini]RDY31975.1 DeoR/GlpR transcriptional regulator [Lachnotalea glycerini]